MYISLADFLLFIIVIVVLAAGTYLIITLKNLNSLIKGTRQLIERNTEPLTKSVALLPETIRNTGELAKSAQVQIDEIGTTVSSIGGSLAETAASFSEKTVSGVSFVNTVVDVISIVKEYLDSRKR